MLHQTDNLDDHTTISPPPQPILAFHIVFISHPQITTPSSPLLSPTHNLYNRFPLLISKRRNPQRKQPHISPNPNIHRRSPMRLKHPMLVRSHSRSSVMQHGDHNDGFRIPNSKINVKGQYMVCPRGNSVASVDGQNVRFLRLPRDTRICQRRPARHRFREWDSIRNHEQNCRQGKEAPRVYPCSVEFQIYATQSAIRYPLEGQDSESVPLGSMPP